MQSIVLSSDDDAGVEAVGKKKSKDKKDKTHKKDKKDKKTEKKDKTTELRHDAAVKPPQDVVTPPIARDPKIPLAKSTLYNDDVLVKGHTSVWGSLWENAPEGKGAGRWGYACCQGSLRKLPCPRAEGTYEEEEAEKVVFPGWRPETEASAKAFENRSVPDADVMDDKEVEDRKKRRVEEWDKRFKADEPQGLADVAEAIMASDYGAAVDLPEGKVGIPLRMITRRKEVSWEWMCETQPFIGISKRALSPDGW